MLSIAIVEDEKEATDVLSKDIQRFCEESGEKFSVSCYASGLSFLSESAKSFDVVFMDIEMPGLNGMDTAKKFRERDTKAILIFVTNLSKYAIQGYQVNAMDYFLKPIHYEDFRMRMIRILEIKKKAEPLSFTIISQSGATNFKSSSLLYIESNAHKIIIHTEDEKAFSWIRPNVIFGDSPKTLKGANLHDFEEHLKKYGFSRCNSGYLVNLKDCKSIEGYDLKIGNETLSISHGRRKEFLSDFIKAAQESM